MPGIPVDQLCLIGICIRDDLLGHDLGLHTVLHCKPAGFKHCLPGLLDIFRRIRMQLDLSVFPFHDLEGRLGVGGLERRVQQIIHSASRRQFYVQFAHPRKRDVSFGYGSCHSRVLGLHIVNNYKGPQI